MKNIAVSYPFYTENGIWDASRIEKDEGKEEEEGMKEKKMKLFLTQKIWMVEYSAHTFSRQWNSS